jgi:hypothetical protein
MSPATLKTRHIQTESVLAVLPVEFKKLTVKQRLFIVHYAITRKGVEAARLAGYEGNYNTLHAVASENLQKPTILAAFDAYMRPQFERHGVTVERVIANIADLAFAPWGDYISVKESQGRIVNVKMPLNTKMEALKVLVKMLRITGEQNEEITQFIDQSQNIHVDAKSPEEARRALLALLNKRIQD